MKDAKTTKARAIWSWGLGPFGFCIGAFVFAFGASIWVALLVMLALWLATFAWVVRAPIHGQNRKAWLAASFIGMPATIVLWFLFSKYVPPPKWS